MISEKMQNLLNIFDNVETLSPEALNVLQQRLTQKTSVVPQYHQMSLDMFPNTDLLNKFIKYISYQDCSDLARLSNSNESNIEDRITANILKQEIIAQLQDIKS